MIQSQALNHFTEKEAQSFSSSGTPQTIGLGYSLNPERFNTEVAPIPSLDYYQALIKSVHLPSSQFPVADAGIKGHMHPAKAHVL